MLSEKGIKRLTGFLFLFILATSALRARKNVKDALFVEKLFVEF